MDAFHSTSFDLEGFISTSMACFRYVWRRLCGRAAVCYYLAGKVVGIYVICTDGDMVCNGEKKSMIEVRRKGKWGTGLT